MESGLTIKRNKINMLQSEYSLCTVNSFKQLKQIQLQVLAINKTYSPDLHFFSYLRWQDEKVEWEFNKLWRTAIDVNKKTDQILIGPFWWSYLIKCCSFKTIDLFFCLLFKRKMKLRYQTHKYSKDSWKWYHYLLTNVKLSITESFVFVVRFMLPIYWCTCI